MKKYTFYSLMYKDNRTQAVEHEGYTDGVYNYYKNFSTWYAISPAVGLSVAMAPTRKEAATMAHKLTEKVKDKLKAMPDAVERFARARYDAKTEEAKR